MNEPSSLDRLRIRVDAFRARNAPQAGIERRQRERLGELLDFVLRESRFYRELYRGIERPLRSLDALPPVTKPRLMERFDAVVTDPEVRLEDLKAFTADVSRIGERFLGRYPVWTTSGTTGEPGIFLQDGWSMTATDAVGDRWTLEALRDARNLWRLLAHNGRIAEIAVGGGHYAAASGVALFRKEHRLLRSRMRLVAADRPLAETAAELDAFQPAIMIGYPTVLLELERMQRSGRLALTPAYIGPSGEPITTGEKDRLRETFGACVREVYGATEFYSMAVECGHGSLHANTDWAILEPVDADYRPVEPGAPSETVLVTNLATRIQPLIRYDLGDRITVLEDRCPCGSAFPVIEVEGRQGEVLRFETDEGREVPIFPLPLAGVVEEAAGVRRAQIVKTGPKALRVRLSLETGASADAVWDEVEKGLSGYLGAHGLRDVSLERAEEEPARDPRSGKFRHVWSEV